LRDRLTVLFVNEVRRIEVPELDAASSITTPRDPCWDQDIEKRKSRNSKCDIRATSYGGVRK